MDRPREHFAQWSESGEEDEYHTISLVMWNLKKKQMSKTEQKQTHRHREQSELPEGRRVGGDG